MFSSSKHPRALRIGVLLAALAAVPLAFIACDDSPVVPLPVEGAPDALLFSVSAFEGSGGRVVQMRGDTVVFRRITSHGSSVSIDSVRVVPTSDDWRRFWAAAEEAGVRNWRPHYLAEGIVDGMGWGLRLEAEGEIFESEGSNAFPDSFGGEHENQVTDAFRVFTDAIGELVGQPVL